MSISEKYLTQATAWLEEEARNVDVQLYIDVPEIGWVTAHKIETADGMLTCEHTSGRMALKGIIMCTVDKVLATRRVEDGEFSTVLARARD